MFPEKNETNENEIKEENREVNECENQDNQENENTQENNSVIINLSDGSSSSDTLNTSSEANDAPAELTLVFDDSAEINESETEQASPSGTNEEDTKKTDNKEKKDKKDKDTNSGGYLGALFDIVEMVAISISIVIILITFVVRYSKVDGSSMTYTIKDSDCVLVQIIGYKPTKGDIIVLQAPDYDLAKPLIKRVIATEHDKLEINFRTWEVKVNGMTIREDYIRYNPLGDEQYNDSFLTDNPDAIMHFDRSIGDIPGGSFDPETYTFKITIPTGKLFVMGDNRNNSHDSRSADIGLVDERFVVGKAGVRIYPFDDFGVLD